MASPRDEQDAHAAFTERYGRGTSTATREFERLVMGADWGGSGYTTLAQADVLRQELDLSNGSRLLDIGSGRGWPALYLAKTSGCSVVLTDLPEEGLRVARDRATRERLARRAAPVAASARHLPFRPETFDAVVHTDVLC